MSSCGLLSPLSLLCSWNCTHPGVISKYLHPYSPTVKAIWEDRHFIPLTISLYYKPPSQGLPPSFLCLLLSTLLRSSLHVVTACPSSPVFTLCRWAHQFWVLNINCGLHCRHSSPDHSFAEWVWWLVYNPSTQEGRQKSTETWLQPYLHSQFSISEL